MPKPPRTQRELQQQVRDLAETKIRGWAGALRLDPDDYLRGLHTIFESYEHVIRLAEERKAVEDFDLVREILLEHLPVVIRIQPGLLAHVPPSPPRGPSATAMRALAEGTKEIIIPPTNGTADDFQDDDANDGVEIASTFRRAIVEAFSPHLRRPIRGEKRSGRLATLSLWLAPDHGVDKSRWENIVQKREWQWNALKGLERRAIANGSRKSKRRSVSTG